MDTYAVLDEVIHEARNPVEARVVAMALEEEGIPSRVDDAVRWDEFAVAQRLMNTTEIKVFIAHADVARARDVVARVVREQQERRKEMAASEPTSPEATGRKGIPRWVKIGLAVFVLVDLLLLLFFATR